MSAGQRGAGPTQLEHRLPVEWFAVSSGALIAMDSRHREHGLDRAHAPAPDRVHPGRRRGQHRGHRHQRRGAAVLERRGDDAHPHQGHPRDDAVRRRWCSPASRPSTSPVAVSAEDNFGIGGYDRVMGPNGQAQYWAPSLPRRARCCCATTSSPMSCRASASRGAGRPPTRSTATCAPSLACRAGELPVQHGRRRVLRRAQPRAQASPSTCARSCARSPTPTPTPLERWRTCATATPRSCGTTTVGGIPVCLLGLESHTVGRQGYVPADGPPAWTSGTLFPQSSRKTARAINAASGNRPLVVLANLSGFDGSPESMRRWQLEYGAEIGRAVTNFDGPIVFVVVSRYHGGAFVVFSKALNESMEIAAVEGSYASVIGGAPGGRDGVRPRGQAAHRARPPGPRGCATSRASASGTERRPGDARAGQDHRAGAIGEARRGGRRVRCDPHDPARAARRLGRSHHPCRRAPAVRRRRTRTRHGAPRRDRLNQQLSRSGGRPRSARGTARREAGAGRRAAPGGSRCSVTGDRRARRRRRVATTRASNQPLPVTFIGGPPVRPALAVQSTSTVPRVDAQNRPAATLRAASFADQIEVGRLVPLVEFRQPSYVLEFCRGEEVGDELVAARFDHLEVDPERSGFGHRGSDRRGTRPIRRGRSSTRRPRPPARRGGRTARRSVGAASRSAQAMPACDRVPARWRSPASQSIAG